MEHFCLLISYSFHICTIFLVFMRWVTYVPKVKVAQVVNVYEARQSCCWLQFFLYLKSIEHEKCCQLQIMYPWIQITRYYHFQRPHRLQKTTLRQRSLSLFFLPTLWPTIIQPFVMHLNLTIFLRLNFNSNPLRQYSFMFIINDWIPMTHNVKETSMQVMYLVVSNIA